MLYKMVFVNFRAHDTQNFDLLTGSLNRFSHKLYIITMSTSRLVGDLKVSCKLPTRILIRK